MKKSELIQIIREEIKSILESKIKVDPKIIRKYKIPSFALQWDGINLPESGVYVSDRKVKIGDVTYENGKPVVVIGITDLGPIGTKAHNIREGIELDDIPEPKLLSIASKSKDALNFISNLKRKGFNPSNEKDFKDWYKDNMECTQI